MNRLSPRNTVLSGATIGLIAGVAIYGAVSSSATAKVASVVQPASANVAVARANAAPCAAGEKLEDGVCVVHIESTVVIPAPSSGAILSADPSTSGDDAVEPSDQVGAETEAESDAAEAADDAAEHAAETAADAAEHAAETAAGAAEQAPDVAEHAVENDS